MQLVERSTEHEMVAHFLKTEFTSPRWGRKLQRLLNRNQLSHALINHPNTTNTADNGHRLHLLSEFRGYRRNRGLFENFPDAIVWTRVALTPDELWRVKYTNDDYWVALSGGSRLPRDAARAIHAGEIVFDMPNDGYLCVAQTLRSGATLPPLILVQAEQGADVVVLKGHGRLTAYALVPEAITGPLSMFLGTSPSLYDWDLY